MLPYWEGIDADIAVDYIVNRIADLKAVFPDKPIVIAEVGWPSNGRTRKSAVASEANQASFLRRFLHRAQTEKYIYYVMEAFDQPWKRETEGAVGAYWGVYNVDREPKFPFTEDIVPIPRWYVLAAVSVVIAASFLCLLWLDSRTLQTARAKLSGRYRICGGHGVGVDRLRLHSAVPDDFHGGGGRC